MDNGLSGNLLGRRQCHEVHTEQLFTVKFLFVFMLDFRCQILFFLSDNKLWIYAGYDGNARLNDMWTVSLVVSTIYPLEFSKNTH